MPLHLAKRPPPISNTGAATRRRPSDKAPPLSTEPPTDPIDNARPLRQGSPVPDTEARPMRLLEFLEGLASPSGLAGWDSVPDTTNLSRADWLWEYAAGSHQARLRQIPFAFPV